MPPPINETMQNPAQEIDLAAKIAFLGAAKHHGRPCEVVEIVDTHMSVVFLVGDLVYKLKKSIKTSYLDFSTLSARASNCREEIRLNRRFAPDVYLGLVALTLEADGGLALGGTGQVVDWLVKMRRLPSEKALDEMIKRQAVSRADIEGVADQLLGFYKNAPPADISKSAYLAIIFQELTENETVLERPEFTTVLPAFSDILRKTRAFVTENRALFGDRLKAGHIIEGHGDLRPQHVYLTTPPVIVDGLEFNKNLRLIDPYDELVFLGFECEMLGAPWVAPLVMQRAANALKGDIPEQLLGFYETYRATLRARLALAHLLEPVPRKPTKWMPLARKCLAIAERAALRMSPPATR